MTQKDNKMADNELGTLSQTQLSFFKLLPTEEKLNHIYAKLLKLDDNDFI